MVLCVPDIVKSHEEMTPSLDSSEAQDYCKAHEKYCILLFELRFPASRKGSSWLGWVLAQTEMPGVSLVAASLAVPSSQDAPED